MAQIFYLLITVPVILTIVHSQNCNPKSCNGKTHTLCLYRSPRPASACNAVSTDVLNDQEKNEIVIAHNQFRALVASGREKRGNPGPQPAGNIAPLKWDEELAKIAQRWANQCSFGHDQCRNVERFKVGQNVASKSSTGGFNAKLSELVQMWYDEVADYNSYEVSKFKWQQKPAIGHYTQLVWGDTTTVGCGAVRYKDTSGWYNTYLVCNYGPAGNFIDHSVYQTR